MNDMPSPRAKTPSRLITPFNRPGKWRRKNLQFNLGEFKHTTPEGKVHEGKIIRESKKRKKVTRVEALKPHFWGNSPREMARQLKIIRTLDLLNKRGAGFNITPLFMVKRAEGVKSIIIRTPFPYVDGLALPVQERKDYFDSIADQRERMGKYGIRERTDFLSFTPVLNRKTGKYVAIITNPENLELPTKK
jgi:hypothetical protein